MSASYTGSRRASQRMSWFLLFLIGVALTVILYFVKTHSQAAKKDVRQLAQAIAEEEAAIRVLRAELAYLSSPARLSELNKTHLSLKPISPEQEISAEALDALFPMIEVEKE